MKDKRKDKKAPLADIFKKELEIADKSQQIEEKTDITFDELSSEYRYLSQQYQKLLNDTIKIMHIGDRNYKKLMAANEQIQEQKKELEILNRE